MKDYDQLPNAWESIMQAGRAFSSSEGHGILVAMAVARGLRLQSPGDGSGAVESQWIL